MASRVLSSTLRGHFLPLLASFCSYIRSSTSSPVQLTLNTSRSRWQRSPARLALLSNSCVIRISLMRRISLGRRVLLKSSSYWRSLDILRPSTARWMSKSNFSLSCLQKENMIFQSNIMQVIYRVWSIILHLPLYCSLIYVLLEASCYPQNGIL